ncbi:hypothetical protein [Deinococcus roseus]|uniref:Uncharacterized protein n=1 Tax=Deinococcus roseus TaxID=392414 RepID=A0ABQ2CUV3_9DEIO|nr:hypothetical protein [Deinococcus roseus]GGJ18944.1 hypothetical protein GCM10008938_01170 [Deinococcus roseus]
MTASDGQHHLQTLLNRLYPSEQHRRDALMLHGEEVLGLLPFDLIELKHPSGTPAGLVFILPYSVHPGSRAVQVPSPLPEWSFCMHILLCEGPEPLLDAQHIEQQILAYLQNLAHQDPETLHELLQLHDAGLKTLALEDETLYRLLIHHFVFETTRGNLNLQEYLKHTGYLRFIPHPDQYRQVEQVARAQEHFIINASYPRDTELLTLYAKLYPDSSVELMDAAGYATHLPMIEHPSLEHLLENARQVLQEFQLTIDMRSFKPASQPALLVASEAYKHHQHFQKNRTHLSPLWTEVIEQLIEQEQAPQARLFLNFDSPLVQSLLEVQDLAVMQESLRMIYLQAVLLGRHPISDHEMDLLAGGLQSLVTWGLQASRYRNLN